MSKKTATGQQMQVILGSHTIRAFVAAPKGFNVMGIVRFGAGADICAEFGLLATTEEGTYFRVNGSTVTALDGDAVNAAIRTTIAHGRGRPYVEKCSHQPVVVAHEPTIIVRKRRRLAVLQELRNNTEMARLPLQVA
jgi:hypothetical protein